MVSPGILDPKADEAVQRCLERHGSSKAEVIGGYENVALDLIAVLRRKNLWGMVEAKWNVAAPAETSDEDVLEALGRRLGCLVSGGAVDLSNAARRFVEAFSTGRLGRVTLELPEES